MTRIQLFLFGAVLIMANHLCAGETSWHIKVNNNPLIINTQLLDLRNDTLFVEQYNRILAIPVDSVKYMKLEKGSVMGVGTVFGVMIGGAIGNGIAKAAEVPNDVMSFDGIFRIVGVSLGLVAGGIVGYLVDRAANADEFYILAPKTLPERIDILQPLIEREQNKNAILSK